MPPIGRCRHAVGQVLQQTAANEFNAFRAGRIITLLQPMPGAWRVRVAGRGMFFLVVQAQSELSLDRVEFVREGGRPGHVGLFPAHEPPRAGVPQLLAIGLSGLVSNASP